MTILKEVAELGALGVVFGSIVMVAVGVLKKYVPGLKAGWTVLLAALLSYGVAWAHASGVCAGARCIEQLLIIGTIAWGTSLGVSWATRLSPTTTKV